jgi:hypothetical protein
MLTKSGAKEEVIKIFKALKPLNDFVRMAAE